jgi:rhodanese-related sulfurtransferase
MGKATVKGLSPKDAFELLESNPKAVLIDVRSSMEYLFVGHPKGAVHVAWIDEPDWKINEHFAPHVRQVMLGGLSSHGEDVAPVLLICRSGKRSLEAGEALIKDGFPEVYNILEGFEGELDKDHHRSTIGGWRFHDLPWEQC